VLAAARGRGIGSDVVRSLQAAAGSRRLPITLATPMLGATGKGVYERLGFRVTAVRPPHYEMAWHPPGLPGLGAAAASGGARMPLLHAADRTD
jgi:ribosomal protein S18 acetylase RimI-like enzyme